MEKDIKIKQLDRELKIEFLNLDIKGTNIEEFYSRKLQEFRLYNSELSFLQKLEASLMQISTPTSEKSETDFKRRYKLRKETDEQKQRYLQLNDKNEITLQKLLTERTFIQDQLVKHEANLKEPIRPETREKLNIWLDYLKLKEKAIEIIIPLPEWTQELVALDHIYIKDKIQESNRKAIAKQYKKNDGKTTVSGSQNLVKVYNTLKYQIELYKKKVEPINKDVAKKLIEKMRKYQLRLEDRGGKGSNEHSELLADIEKIIEKIGAI